MLDIDTINIIKSSVPVLKEKGTEITTYFYKILFENNPEVKSMFNSQKQESGEQPLALAQAILAYAQNIDNLDKISSNINKIAKTHTSVNVKPEQYPIVGENLLKAIKYVLGDLATQEVLDAWSKAYNVLAEVFIDSEKQIYENM